MMQSHLEVYSPDRHVVVATTDNLRCLDVGSNCLPNKSLSHN